MKNVVKITLDIVMTVIFALLFDKNAVSGLKFHEIAGLFACLAFILHKALNWQWIKKVTSNLFQRKISKKAKINFILDALLLFFMTTILISGIMISKVLFTGFGSGSMNYKKIHISLSYIALAFVGIHIGLHWDCVINTLNRIVRFKSEKKLIKYASMIIVLSILGSGIHSMYSVGYFSKISMITGGAKIHGVNEFKGIRQHKMPPQGRSNGNNSKTTGSQREKRGIHREARNFEQSGIFKVLYKYTGILAVFSIAAYYTEKILIRKQK